MGYIIVLSCIDKLLARISLSRDSGFFFEKLEKNESIMKFTSRLLCLMLTLTICNSAFAEITEEMYQELLSNVCKVSKKLCRELTTILLK